jgi:radical SAM enzyme (TIGR01210 family)
MAQPDVQRQIQMGSQDGGKTYGFNDGHSPHQPAQSWFQESIEGMILFVVFYTQACRWSRCLGCNLPSLSSLQPVGYRQLIDQIDHLFADSQVASRYDEIRKLIVSNNGSVLDQATFSSTALIYLMARINLNLRHLSVLCLETRLEYVDLAELEFLARAAAEGDTATAIELAIGFEAFDDRIRNEVFMKGFELAAFERFIADVATYGFRVKTYLMQKPVPGLSDDAAIADIHRAIDYLADLAARYDVTINLHLNPTYVAAGTALAREFARGNYTPPLLADVARAALHARGKGLGVFLGLFDEGLAVPGGSFLRSGDGALVATLERFNQTQDFQILSALP